MPDAYDIHDGRFVQVRGASSAANGLNISAGTCPAGKVWTILSAYASCSVSESQTYWFAVLDRSGNYPFPVTLPATFAVNPATSEFLPLVREGMELKLFPGEQIHAYRAAATAGSTITARIRYIETDLPLYDYVEPQERLRIQKFRRALVPNEVRAGGIAFSGVRGGSGGFAGGGGGSPKPK